MLTQNVRSGIGSQRDAELANGGRGRRNNTRHFNLGVDRERAVLPITLNQDLHHRDYLAGDLVCVTRERLLVPLDLALPFAGVIEQVGQDNHGRYVASLCTRGAVHVRVDGLRADTRTRTKVYARPAGPTQVFSVNEPGVCVGELLAIERADREIALVGLRLADDAPQFELGGARPSSSWTNGR